MMFNHHSVVLRFYFILLNQVVACRIRNNINGILGFFFNDRKG